MSKPKRIICYAINGAGMGHVTRLLTVAKWLRRYGTVLDQKPPEIIFLTSSDASDMLAEAGFAAFKIPSKTVAQKTDLNKQEYKRLAKHFVWNTLGVFSPDLLVVDTFPSGSFDELFQLMDGPFKKSFIYRKVKKEYAARPMFRSAVRLYDQVVAPHAEARAFQQFLPPELESQVSFTGEVIQYDHTDFLSPSEVRQQLGVPNDKKLVYLSAGGGGDPNAELQLLHLVESLKESTNLHLLVGAGPLYRGKQLRGANISWFTGTRVGQYFAAVDCALSAGGYNTFHELLFARVPTAFYHQHKVADDQLERIQQAAEAGACQHLELTEQTSPETIQSVVNELLQTRTQESFKRAAEDFLPDNGAARCAIELLEPIYTRQRLEWARLTLTPQLASSIESITSDSQSLGTWLNTLLPHDQLHSLSNDSRLEKLITQLSSESRSEVESILESDPDRYELQRFQQEFVDLINSLEAQTNIDNRTQFESELQKTVFAAMKKQPLENERARNWIGWVCAILSEINQLITNPEHSFGDSMSLYRTFPKIVDANVEESFRWFRRYMVSQVQEGHSIEQIRNSIQLLKLAHQRVTQSTLQAKLNQSLSIERMHER